MTIEQIIKYLPAPICGDTVIGKEKQKEYDAHDSAVIILRKYQRIEHILDARLLEPWEMLEEIKRVIEDGNGRQQANG